MSQETFQKDQRVIFRRGLRWYEGKITRVFFRPSGDVSSYVVQEHEPLCEFDLELPFSTQGDSYTISHGKENIRVFPYEKTYFDKLHEAADKLPIFKDPFAHLYMETGHIKWPSNGEIEGIIDMDNLMIMVQTVSFRRKRIEGSIDAITVTPPLEILHSILPKERNLARLRELAQKDSSAMLQLADVYRYGLFGARLDLASTIKLYMCAANGMSEQEFKVSGLSDWNYVYPMGIAEALAGCSYELWITLTLMCGIKMIDDYEGVFEVVKLQVRGKIETKKFSAAANILENIAAYLGHACRRGWVSPFALSFANAIVEDTELYHVLYPHSLHLESALKASDWRHNVEPTPDRDIVDNSDCEPTDYQMECFIGKATEIFLELPIRRFHSVETTRGLEELSTDIHVEYRVMGYPPYPIVVFVVHPHQNFYTVELPDELTYTPFSKDAIEYVWGHMVFRSMHRQGEIWNRRFRPSLITFVGKPGDQLLASYIKEQIGGDMCGTKIKTIDPRKSIVTLRGKRRSMEEIVNFFEDAVTRRRKRSTENTDSFRTPMEQTSSRFHNLTTIPAEELCSYIEQLKQEGDEYFQQGRTRAAKRCYTEAINEIKINVMVNDQLLTMLASLLSNRAACFLEMTKCMNLDSSKSAIFNGLSDCETVLKNQSCMRILPSSIKAKIEKLKVDFTSKLSFVTSQSSGALRSEDTVTAAPSSPQRRGKKNSKKTKKKARRRQRRKQRMERDRDEANPERPTRNEDREDERETISITTGKELLESKMTPFVTEKEDSCPCCLDRFSVELDGVFCAVIKCGHTCCLPCLSVLMDKSKNCPVCRVPIQKDILLDAFEPIVSCTPCLQGRIASLPLNENDGMQVAKELCLSNHFKIPNVLSALDVMLTDGLQASLRSSKNLSPAQKQEIYEEARAPVDVLWAEAKKLRSEMDRARDMESQTYLQWKKRLIELQTTLIPTASKTAVDFIWEKMNSAGSMGIESASGEIEIDFHALHVNEAKERFHERVLPILPAVDSILLVVGRGNHSEGGIAKLKPALKKLIENHSKTRYSSVEGNDGMIRVRWEH